MHVYVLYVNQQDDPFTVFNPDQHSFETRVAGGAGGALAPGAGGGAARGPPRGGPRGRGGARGFFAPDPPVAFCVTIDVDVSLVPNIMNKRVRAHVTACACCACVTCTCTCTCACTCVSLCVFVCVAWSYTAIPR
jgi:hypothetical protein